MVSLVTYCTVLAGISFVHGIDLENKTGINVYLSPTEIKLGIDDHSAVNVDLSGHLSEPADIYFTYQIDGEPTKNREDMPLITPMHNLTISTNKTRVSATITGQSAGHLILGINSSTQEFRNLENVFIRVTVVHSVVLHTMNMVVGWIYFAIWTISFYPQAILNWHRKSVVGLSFDFIGYNIIGYIAYGVYNVGMYWIPEIQREYTQTDVQGTNPVQLNDVFFTIHAVFIMVIVTIQCYLYDRGGQRLSKTCIVLLCVCMVFALLTLFFAVGQVITWLRYIFYLSYIKLFVTLIKYTPQVYLNYRRKSTMGWSIWGVITDMLGGVFSLLQMLLIAYNSDDWNSLFGDPTKFGLGLIAIVYNLIFVAQHFIIYRGKKPYDMLINKDDVVS